MELRPFNTPTTSYCSLRTFLCSGSVRPPAHSSSSNCRVYSFARLFISATIPRRVSGSLSLAAAQHNISQSLNSGVIPIDATPVMLHDYRVFRVFLVLEAGLPPTLFRQILRGPPGWMPISWCILGRGPHCTHILFIVNVPEPVHPEVSPVKVQVPVTVLLLIVPCRVSVLLPLVVPVPDTMVN
jgi:hypothetical protein